jgi:hypothetical protein
LVVTTDKLSVHAATTSAELAGIISDETGSGALVFGTSPTLTTPNLGTPSAINLTNATAVPSDATKAPLASPTFTGTVNLPATVNQGSSVSTATVGFEMAPGRTGSGTTYIDLIGDTTYTDYGLRIIRNSGSTGGSGIYSRGTGSLVFEVQEAGAIGFNTGSVSRMTIDGSGNTIINAVGDASTTTAARGGGYMGIPQSAASGSGSYTVVAADAGEHIYTTTTRTVTIPANSALALPIGTALTFISGVGATTTIAITTDTMYLAGAGTTGSRTLAAHGMATAVKVASTTWYISGNGLT